jgi:hypothetical protein
VESRGYPALYVPESKRQEDAKRAQFNYHTALFGWMADQFRSGKSNSSDSGGHWVTIGAKTEQDGKKRGGSPVFIGGDGTILKGHPGLTGKRLRKAGGFAKRDPKKTTRQEQHTSRGHAHAKRRQTAKAEGFDPNHVEQLADDIKAHDAEFKKERHSVLKTAREALEKRSGNAGWRTLKQRIDRGDVEGHDQVRFLDEIADETRSAFPHHWGPHDDTTERLYELLAEGNPQPMSEEQAWNEAMEHLHGQRGHQWSKKPKEEAPF